MARYELRLPGGGTITAISDIRLTWLTNDSQDLSLGSACAAMLQLRYYDPVAPEAGTSLECWEDNTCLGTFYCEQPSRSGGLSKLTAYDAMIRFDRNVEGWLEAQSFPATAQDLLEALCAHCGVPLSADTALPAQEIPAFSCRGITGRLLLRYLGQLAGRFFLVNPRGELEAKWYSSGGGRLGQDLHAVIGSFTCADYTTAPIGRVLLRAAGDDAAAQYPPDAPEDANTYLLQNNPLLDQSGLQAVAQRLYEQLSGYRCRPFSCELLPGGTVQPGQTVTFSDIAGAEHTAPVMELTLHNGRRTLRATGSASLQSATALGSLALESLPGRVLTVEQTAQGLKAENADMKGNAAALLLALDSISSRVTAVERDAEGHATAQALSELEQRADALSLSITQLQQQTDAKADAEDLEAVTEHFYFTAGGLSISNSATGMCIHVSEEAVRFSGGTDHTTVITPNAMRTTGLQVDTRLDVGSFSFLPRSNGNLSLRSTAAALR